MEKTSMVIYFLMVMGISQFSCDSVFRGKGIDELYKTNGDVLNQVEKQDESANWDQIRLNLHNKNGIPYSYSDVFGYIIEGFDVDDDENFYFLGGDSSTIVSFKKDGLVYRSKYSEFLPNAIHVKGDSLLIFDYKFGDNNLFILNKNDGSILNEYPNIITNTVNNYYFADTSLVLRIFNNEEPITIDTELAYVEYDFQGNYIQTINNLYGVADGFNVSEEKFEFVGEWNDMLIFWSFDFKMKAHRFFLYNREGKMISERSFEEDLIGKDLYGSSSMPQEHRKMTNEKIYILGKVENDIAITILPLQDVFPDF